jgi:hypothetical protein
MACIDLPDYGFRAVLPFLALEEEAMPKNNPVVPVEIVERAILLIRDQKVLLDRDLAQLYGVETRVLNQAVRRNTDRFPDDFMFSLTRDEIMRISQFVISSHSERNQTLKFSKSVLAFTEYGVAMLSSVLNSESAIEVNPVRDYLPCTILM